MPDALSYVCPCNKTRETMKKQSELLRQASAHGITFIDLRIDFAFKYIFGTPGNEDLLLRLVQAILPDKDIISASLDSQEQIGLRKDARKSIVDVKCTTEGGDKLVIEMQVKPQNDFGDRMVFYSSFPISNLLHKGEDDNYKLTPVFIIGITNFIIPDIRPNDDVINYYSIRNRKDNGVVLTESINYVTVELPKLTKTLAEVMNTDELILYTIKHLGEMNEMPIEYVGSGLEKMFGLSNFAAMTESEQYEYLARFMAERDEKSSRRYARETGYAEGKAEGKAEGRVEGRVEGEAEGKAKGLRETARRMLVKGFDINMIAELTTLSPNEILALR